METMGYLVLPLFKPSTDLGQGPNVVAERYFASTHRLAGTPAYDARRLQQAPTYARQAADEVLSRGLGIDGMPYPKGAPTIAALTRSRSQPPGVDGLDATRLVRRRACLVARPVRPSAALQLVLPTSGVVIATGPHAPSRVSLRRFAPSFSPRSYSAPDPGEPFVVAPARGTAVALPWHARLSIRGRTTVCSAPTAVPLLTGAPGFESPRARHPVDVAMGGQPAGSVDLCELGAGLEGVRRRRRPESP